MTEAVDRLLAWIEPNLLRLVMAGAYVLLVCVIGVYSLHRCRLLVLYRRHRREHARPAARFQVLPRVTVQLPMFNEQAVAARVIDAACALDYPRDRLQIQVLDDSTDASADIARRRVDHWAARGVNIQYHHRSDRTGYKAGALQAAMPDATGELIALFDADFIPPPKFLRRTVHYFTDPKLGMVQACWSHLNRVDSLLTRAQAVFLDGHFHIEHTARNRSGAWFNFNGTAGVWRRSTIDEAGGWQHDTLTEDVDLSYRAQLVGWRFLYLPWLRCPAELPPQISAFKSQQHRWTKGAVQVAMKLLPTLLRAPIPRPVKLEAFFHLTCPLVYLCITMLALLMYPLLAVGLKDVSDGNRIGMTLGLVLLMLGTVSPAVFYAAGQAAAGRSAWRTLLQAPLLMALGVGMALSNAIACLEALLGHESPFVRTPKYNRSAANSHAQLSDPPAPTEAASPEPADHPTSSNLPRPRPHRPLVTSLHRNLWILELAMGLYMLVCTRLALDLDHTRAAAPFLLLFAAGYLYVGFTTLGVRLAPWLRHRLPPFLLRRPSSVPCRATVDDAAKA